MALCRPHSHLLTVDESPPPCACMAQPSLQQVANKWETLSYPILIYAYPLLAQISGSWKALSTLRRVCWTKEITMFTDRALDIPQSTRKIASTTCETETIVLFKGMLLTHKEFSPRKLLKILNSKPILLLPARLSLRTVSMLEVNEREVCRAFFSSPFFQWGCSVLKYQSFAWQAQQLLGVTPVN